MASFPDDNFTPLDFTQVDLNVSPRTKDVAEMNSSDDDVEFIKEVGQTKYSLVRENITPAPSIPESVVTVEAAADTLENGNGYDANEGNDTDEVEKLSSASSLKLQAMKDEAHAFDDSLSKLAETNDAGDENTSPEARGEQCTST